MDRSELAPHIDHTVLGPATTPADVERVLDEAAEHGMNACIPPCYVGHAVDHAPDVTLATVVGFPHGQHATGVKVTEAETVWEEGADEVDLVANAGYLKAGDDDAYAEELAEVVAAVPLPVKVIVETALLDDEELRRACEAAREADAEMVKTSTGFADSVASETQRANGKAVSGGAEVRDVEIMSDYLPVKASGGVGTYDEAMAMLDAGAERIGASSGVDILDGAPE